MASTDEFQVGFSTLTRGHLYPIKSIVKTETAFNGKVVPGMKVFILDDDLELTTYLPKKLQNDITDAKFAEINTAGSTDAKFTLCYYGKMKKQMITEFYGRIHNPNEGHNAKLLKDMTKLMSRYSEESQKRNRDDDDSDPSPSKVKKIMSKQY